MRKIVAIIIVVLCMGAFVYRVIKTPERIKDREDKIEHYSSKLMKLFSNK